MKNPPLKPNKPYETITIYKTIATVNLGIYVNKEFSPPAEADHISVEHIDYDYDSIERVEVRFSKKMKIPNLKYDKEHKKYLKKLVIYDKQMIEWNEYVKMTEIKDKDHRRKQYEELKKEFKE